MFDNYAFIDSQNLNLGIRDQGWVLDFKPYRTYLRDKYCITKAYIFIGYLAENNNLYSFLKQVGFELVFKPTLVLPEGKVKGNVDAELVLHAMIQYENYSKALIVTGDGDFTCLVEYLNLKNKLLGLMIPNRFRYSALLANTQSRIIFMNGLKFKLMFEEK